jgi:hypothetical protein
MKKIVTDDHTSNMSAAELDKKECLYNEGMRRPLLLLDITTSGRSDDEGMAWRVLRLLGLFVSAL